MRRTSVLSTAVCLAVLLTFAGIAILAGGCKRNAPPPIPPEEKPAAEKKDVTPLLADTNLPDLQDAVKPLTSYMGTKGLLLVFADVSCPYTGRALGDLPEVAPKLAGFGIPTVVVNVSDAREAVLKTYAQRNAGTPVVFDTTDATKDRWKITSVPTVVLVGPDGNQTYRAGAVWKNLASAVETAQGLSPGTVVFKSAGTEFG